MEKTQMGKRQPLSQRFLASVASDLRDHYAAVPDLETFLAGQYESARAAWPTVRLEVDPFLAYVAERIPDEGAADPMLRAIRWADLYVACASANGDSKAVVAIEQAYFGDIERHLVRVGFSGTERDEAKQILRQQLFTMETGAPRIAQYSGRGALSAWLRVSVVRQALKVIRKEKREITVDDEMLLDLPARENNPELQYIKDLSSDATKGVLRDCMKALAPRERNLLRQHYLDGLSFDELGQLYRVNRRTAQRWIIAARETLLSEMKKLLRQRVGITPSQYESFVQFAQSNIDMTMRSLLDSSKR